MRELRVTGNDAGMRLDRYISKMFPRLPSSLLQKSVRVKNIKLNGKRASINDRLQAGDVISLYIHDQFLDSPASGEEWTLISRPRFDICFENEHLLIAVKPSGMPCQPDARETVDTLINHIKAYCRASGAWDPESAGSFAPALCNRIDRNTEGLVIAAKTAPALRDINKAIRERKVEKKYLCIVHGTPSPPAARLESYLFKDARDNRVYVRQQSCPGAQYAATDYLVLRSSGNFSLVECTLLTGRTHQIRVQMADIGHPLAGDGKYGNIELPGFNSQSLLSFSVTFQTNEGVLRSLSKRTFSVDTAPFISTFDKLISASNTRQQ